MKSACLFLACNGFVGMVYLETVLTPAFVKVRFRCR